MVSFSNSSKNSSISSPASLKATTMDSQKHKKTDSLQSEQSQPTEFKNNEETQSASAAAVASFVRERGGDCPIHRVLLANNGIAAVKEMRSVRKWAYETFGNDRAIEFIAMATPDDFKANAEYIKMADRVVNVPGGTNNHNYANVDLIVKLAQEQRVQAVWAGWGHASENPRLPETLSRCVPPIAFIGPQATSMRALGDKISSTIVAQSLGIPVVPWSGSGIQMNPEDCFDEEKSAPIYRKACVTTFEEVQAAVPAIGFPLMIKASEGGGGKGIRKVLKAADLKLAFEQVAQEVPGSPIFLMALSQHSRHLEIQVVADRHGNCVTLFGRDCSVQRRHQKIIEEAPISCVAPQMALQMEADAIALAKSVRYESVGTVEYLFDIDKQQYYFLELNPRLQVEHPTTEMVSGVNIPATQLQIAMGLPLHAIKDVRRLWCQDDLEGVGEFELNAEKRHSPLGHVVAARITAENPDAGFKPNSGRLQELTFRGFPNTWGYFSVAPLGGLHEFADSQFGHVFAHGANREAARQSMIMALKELSIRGDFRTTVEYLIELLERAPYCQNEFDTAWLDGLIAEQAKTSPPLRIDRGLAVVAGGAAVALSQFASNEEAVLASIASRGIPNPTLLAADLPVQFIHDNISYRCTVRRVSPQTLNLSFEPSGLSINIRTALMPDCGYLMNIGGRNCSVYSRKEGDNYRITINGKTCILESEQDPSTIKSPSPGKLVRFLVEDGVHVSAGCPVAEIEVMKMFIPLLSGESGVIKPIKPPGSAIETGDLIATLQLDNQQAESNVVEFDGNESLLAGLSDYCEPIPIDRIDEELQNILLGHVIPDFKAVVSRFLHRLSDPEEVLTHLTALLSTLRGRIDESLFTSLQGTLSLGVSGFDDFLAVLGGDSSSVSNDKLAPLLAATQLFFPDGTAASHQCFQRRTLIKVLEGYWRVERAFHGDVTAESLYSTLKEFYPEDAQLAACFRSHYNLQYKNSVLFCLLDRLLQSPSLGHELVKNAEFEAALRQLTIFSGPKYFSVVHVTRDLLLQGKSISPLILYQQMEAKLLQALERGEQASLLQDMILGRYASMDALPKLFHHSRSDVRLWALEAYIRRIFQSYSLGQVLPLQLQPASSAMKWTFSRTSTTSAAPPSSEDAFLSEAEPEPEQRQGLICVLEGACRGGELIQMIKDAQFEGSMKRVVYFILPEQLMAQAEGEEDFIQGMVRELGPFQSQLMALNVRRITFALNRSHLISMNYFTLRASLNFAEDSNIRHVEPALAYLLELKRITDHHEITLKYTDPEGQVHIYLAKEKPTSPNGHIVAGGAEPVQKMFVRLLIRPNQMMREHRTMLHFFPVARAILEQMFETLESVMAKEAWIPRVRDQFICSNHLFINIIAIFFHSAEEVAQVLEHLMRYYDERFNRLGIRGAEVAMNLIEVEDKHQSTSSAAEADLRRSRELVSQSQRIRVFFENTLGLVNATEMHAYRESYLEGKLRLDCFWGKPKNNGSEAFASHAQTSDLELRRNRVLKLGSTYIYDFPQLFTHILQEIWGQKSTTASDDLITFSQIQLDGDGISIGKDEDSQKRIGMVAWLVKYKSPEFPDGREFVLIGNDLEHEIGSFGVAEDELFFRASELARERRLPRIYIAANSGAKFGLAAGLLEVLKAAWIDDQDHAKGFDFLYLDEADWQALDEEKKRSIVVEQGAMWNGKQVCKLIAVIGAEGEALGVENLQGSGKIAGATSRAYQETFTLTYVTGRAVGIGAYLVRLGQRTIQRRDAPIILTGYQALNSILGRDVYLSNIQIGGPQIMAANGVTHRTVANDFDGIREIFHWLSFVPVAGGSPLDLAPSCALQNDPIDRECRVPAKEIEADPRALLAGAGGLPGLLDANSWTEYLEMWAKSVIVGRGKLGGIPVGVICTETRTIDTQVPSDPGRSNPSRVDPVRQAGQVWYPDSAWKTAQALRDFRLEGLPILILANWRGFSGGPGDLYDGILQFGSLIVDELSRAITPVFVYLPAGAELRGGSWVVLDSTINPAGNIEMYADPSARAGVLEASGIVAIKFRKREMTKLMCRLEGESRILPAQEEELSCVYRQIAVKYADLHDTTYRMEAKGVIRQAVEFSQARRFFYWRLVRRLREGRFLNIIKNDFKFMQHELSKSGTHDSVLSILGHHFNAKTGLTLALADDKQVAEFLEAEEATLRSAIMSHLKEQAKSLLESKLKQIQ